MPLMMMPKSESIELLFSGESMDTSELNHIPKPRKIKIIDAMAVLRGMKKKNIY